MPVSHERKLATMLFADLVGSTALASERDPEHTRLLLDRFYDAMAVEIRAVEGTLEKFAGDAVMAVFGVPTAYEDHAERALHAALSMRRRFDELFGERLGLRIGVNTGDVVLGAPTEGSSFVSGDAVNVAARLEQAAANGEILAGQRTVAAVGGAFEFGEPTRIDAKGKAEGVLCRSVLRALSLMRPRGAGALPPAFVGRERELTFLQSAYRRTVVDRMPHTLTIVGEAGVGKTRLVRELWGTFVQESPEPLRRIGRCAPYGRATAYEPLGEIVKEHFGILDSDPPGRVRELLGDHEMLGLALSLDVSGDVHPLAVRSLFRDAWVTFLAELLAERPMVVLVEDLHWADQLLVELLEAVAAQVRGPLLVLATARPDGAPIAGGETLRLEPLGGEDPERMLTKLLGSSPPSELRSVVAQAQGNPLFIEEILSTLIDRGFVVRSDGGWRLDRLPSGLVLPDSIHALLAARIDLLPPLEKAALQAGAVIGRTFWAGPMRTLVEQGEPDLSLLEDRDFVYRRATSSLQGESEYAIKHALTREVAYGSIPKARRARLHLAFAEWLESVGGGRDEHAADLAHHYSESVRSEYAELAWPGDDRTPSELRPKAAAWLRRAAELAVGRYEIDDGLALLHRAADLVTDDRTRAEVWRTIGKAHALKFDGDAFWDAMQRAAELDPDPHSRAETYSVLAFETASRGAMWKRRPMTGVLEAWVDRALKLAQPESVARARALLARAYWDPVHGQEAAHEAHQLVERIGDRELRSFAWGALAAAAFEESRYEDAYAWTRRRLSLLPKVSDPDRVGEILELAIPVVTAVASLTEGRQLAAQSEEVAQRSSSHHRLHAVAQAVDVEELAGRWPAIRERTSLVEERVAANLATPCVRNARSLLICAVAWAYDGSDVRAQELEGAADDLGMEGYDYALDPPRLRLALIRRDLGAAERLLKTPPAKTYTMGVGAIAARLDGLAALGDRARVEAEAAPLLRPGIYLEPFALRALAVVRDEETRLVQAVARFEAIGLEWHAEQTRMLLA